ncbi:extradiol dioxygenase [Pigmentiphaga soli]|uniref:Extradiol dioxygenase n=1 Tax=Pigmentiphaga soli TaxID=1007095 RepID=A0ABP8GVD9_9BURK
MSRIVGAFCMSHAPLAVGAPDAPAPEARRNIEAANAEYRRRLEQARPDLIVAFLDDHFENHFRNLMPALSIGIAPEHSGPAAHMMEVLRFERPVAVPGDPATAELLLRELIRAGFDLTRMGKVEYGNNLLVPLKLILPGFDIPVIPIFINVFSPPIPTMRRAYQLGQAVRRIFDASDDGRRVLFMGTGGLSHWPPVWTEGSPEHDAFLQRMKRYQTEGRHVAQEDPDIYSDLAAYETVMASKMQWPLGTSHSLINEQWDRRVLAAFERGDVEFLCGMGYQEIDDLGGHGGHEILNWCAVMGAMNGAPARILAYEPVLEWIGGMGYIAYDEQAA